MNNNKPLKIVFFSSSDFCIPIVEAILTNPNLELLGVVTQPNWENRGKIYKNPISNFAENNNLKLFQPTKLNQSLEEFIIFFGSFDLGVVASYGQIISNKILILPTLGMINWHPSLLPLYRGPTPIQTSIYQGDITSGLTWIKMDQGMDTGNIINQYSFDLTNKNFNQVSSELGIMGGETLDNNIQKILKKETLTKQDNTKATITRMIDKNISLIKPKNLISYQILQHFLAYGEFPKTKIETKKYGLIKLINIEVYRQSIIDISQEDEDFYFSKGKIILKTKEGLILIKELELSNGRRVKSSS